MKSNNRTHKRMNYTPERGEFALCDTKSKCVKLTDNWDEVTCKRCLKVKETFERNQTVEIKEE